MSAAPDPRTIVDRLREDAPWLFAAELGTCVVGSAALAEACRRDGVIGPHAEDVDLAWNLDVAAGRALLDAHGVRVATTVGSEARGTLAFRVGAHRFEITSFRGDGTTTEQQIVADLARRDMTIGAVAWWLATDRILDPFAGVEHWSARRIEPVGSPLDRIVEHPIRWLRWYRRAHELDFVLAPTIRKLRFDPAWSSALPPEAVAAEFRRVLDRVGSPGRFFVELHEAGALPHLAAELAPQFDGRAAGPLRHHPEISQALHLVLALEWAATRARSLRPVDRNALLVAVLCHDLGKGLTPTTDLPSHPGHEHLGVPLVHALLDRLPGLTDPRGRRLAEQVCRLHLRVRRLDEMRAGSLASLYDDELRAADFPLELFVLAVGADVGGRLGCADDGDRVAAQLAAALTTIRAAAQSVDAAAIRAACGTDLERFKQELHQARARAIRAARPGS